MNYPPALGMGAVTIIGDMTRFGLIKSGSYPQIKSNKIMLFVFFRNSGSQLIQGIKITF